MEQLTHDLIIRNGGMADFSSDHLPLLEPQFPFFNLIHTSSPSPISRPLAMPVFRSSTSHPEADDRSKNDTEVTGGRKRKRNNVEKPSDVVHVRAKRGQATDSHSLAERVRRKKINERLSCLQELVPGCHKTMGMAVMLEVVIKYINSLQHQIEFLSMKLLAASLFHDFNSSEMDALDTMQMQQQGGNANGSSGGVALVDMERMAVTEGYGGGGGGGGMPSYFHSSTSPI